MDSTSSDIARNISDNIRQLRESRHLSQEQLAKVSGIPRPTWSNLESGSANPTVTLLLRVASVLQVSLEELIGSPKASCQHFAADQLHTQQRGGGLIRKLLPEKLPGVEFDRMEIPSGTRIGGIPHRTGTREYLTCERGVIELAVSGEIFLARPGDVVVFRGDQRHSYSNRGRETAVGFSVVLLAPGPP